MKTAHELVIKEEIRKTSIPTEINEQFTSNVLTLFFNEPNAKNERLCGGKGASLACLSQITNNIEEKSERIKFTIPNGFTLTSNAFNLQIENNKILNDAIVHVESIAYHRINGSLDEACTQLKKLFNETPIIAKIVDSVKQKLLILNQRSNTTFNLAIRSSAIGEDSVESSSAGQNDSFLGINTFDGVLKSIQMCWASLFSIKSIKYRIQNAQPIQTVMSVVIQKMISAECAGVLFTRHPVDNDPNKLLISANYGLGEVRELQMIYYISTFK